MCVLCKSILLLVLPASHPQSQEGQKPPEVSYWNLTNGSNLVWLRNTCRTSERFQSSIVLSRLKSNGKPIHSVGVNRSWSVRSQALSFHQKHLFTSFVNSDGTRLLPTRPLSLLTVFLDVIHSSILRNFVTSQYLKDIWLIFKFVWKSHVWQLSSDVNNRSPKILLNTSVVFNFFKVTEPLKPLWSISWT